MEKGPIRRNIIDTTAISATIEPTEGRTLIPTGILGLFGILNSAIVQPEGVLPPKFPDVAITEAKLGLKFVKSTKSFTVESLDVELQLAGGKAILSEPEIKLQGVLVNVD
jgi:hypothetical protein